MELVIPVYFVSSYKHEFQQERVVNSIKTRFIAKKMNAPPIYLQAGRPTRASGGPQKRRFRSRGESGPGKYASSSKKNKKYECSIYGEKGTHNKRTCKKKTSVNVEC
jgi:hypothetical protein